MTQTQNGPGPKPASPETDPDNVRREAVERYLFDPEFHARAYTAYSVVKHIAGLDLEGARIGCIVATHLAEQQAQDDHVLADVLRKLVIEANGSPTDDALDLDRGPVPWVQDGKQLSEIRAYIGLDVSGVVLTDEQYRAVQDVLS